MLLDISRSAATGGGPDPQSAFRGGGGAVRHGRRGELQYEYELACCSISTIGDFEDESRGDAGYASSAVIR
jgi:hypothetical protein